MKILNKTVKILNKTGAREQYSRGLNSFIWESKSEYKKLIVREDKSKLPKFLYMGKNQKENKM